MEKIKKENKEKIMEMIKKAGSEEYETSWNEKGILKLKKKSKIKQGRISKARGARFELKVRKDLSSRGWTIDKWSNNVDLENNKLVSSKKIFNPFKKIMVPGAGFPDFISIKHINDELYSVIGVEVKMNGILSKIEKEKCRWYLKNKIFSQIWIAKAIKEGRSIKVEYIDFKERYGK